MKKIREKLREICASGNTALWFSGGKDSTLLLELLIAERCEFTVLCFDEGWTREQRRIVDAAIRRHNLKVYSYLPASATLFGEGDNLTFSADYAVGRAGETIPLLRDVVHTPERCAVDDLKIPYDTSGAPPVFFDHHITGSKRREYHYAFAGRETVTAPEFEVGGARFFCPLFFLSDNDVHKELGRIGIRNEGGVPEHLDTGNLPACTNCLAGEGEVYCPKRDEIIPAIDWNKTANLDAWRAAKGVK